VLDDIVSSVVCPVCRGGLATTGTGLHCASGHSFDVARQGYVNLAAGLGRAALGADSAAAVAARVDFLTAGHFEPLVAELAREAAARWPGGLVLDAGAGPGYHLAAVLEALPGARGIALDSSAPALRMAARSHPRTVAIGWDLREPWPVADAAAGLILNVFAPRNAAEYARVLRADGVLLVVVPGPDHLAPLVEKLGLLTVDAAKSVRLAAALDPYFVELDRTQIGYQVSLDPVQVRTLIAMGPNARHLDDAALAQRSAGLGAITEVNIEVRLHSYRPR
jgi:23S rRNA (guanine745-N1)-methyltransferase